MPTRFTESMDLLIKQTKGKWRASVEVDQVYAHYQEAHPEFHHPSGGQAFYVRDTLYLGQWLGRIGRGLIDKRGVRLDVKMPGVAEGLARGVYLRAPWEFGDLRRSGHPTVTRDNVVIYDRPPQVRRLTDAELRQKKELSYLFEPQRYRRGR